MGEDREVWKADGGSKGLMAERTGHAALSSTIGYTRRSVAVGKSRLESYALHIHIPGAVTLSSLHCHTGLQYAHLHTHM